MLDRVCEARITGRLISLQVPGFVAFLAVLRAVDEFAGHHTEAAERMRQENAMENRDGVFLKSRCGNELARTVITKAGCCVPRSLARLASAYLRQKNDLYRATPGGHFALLWK
jgi:hypothetical protein